MKSIIVLCAFLSLTAVSLGGDYEYSMAKAAREARDKGQLTGRCLLHDRLMKKERVPIVRANNEVEPGDMVPWDIRIHQFPNARHVAVLKPTDKKNPPSTAVIYICPDCEIAEAKWHKEHPQ